MIRWPFASSVTPGRSTPGSLWLAERYSVSVGIERRCTNAVGVLLGRRLDKPDPTRPQRRDVRRQVIRFEKERARDRTRRRARPVGGVSVRTRPEHDLCVVPFEANREEPTFWSGVIDALLESERLGVEVEGL